MFSLYFSATHNADKTQSDFSETESDWARFYCKIQFFEALA